MVIEWSRFDNDFCEVLSAKLTIAQAKPDNEALQRLRMAQNKAL